ncbi:MAG: hypothetical protein VKN33_03685 [Candidatus Sericytochromatia bacterium]|nr:hypothetical protein [Candidatus Sericytochromatia bacterium]
MSHSILTFDAVRDLGSAHTRMVLVGDLGAGKSAALREHYRQLLRAGLRSDRVLVWIANTAQAAAWKEAIKAYDFSHGATLVMTFRSWVRQELLTHWADVEASGLLPGPPPAPEPTFVGISAAQQLLRMVVTPMREQFPVLEDCRTPPMHQLIQILDTYARLVEHGISPLEAAARLDTGHHLSSHSPELHRFVGEAISQYRQFCLKHRVLDHNLQLELFQHTLWAHPAYRTRVREAVDVLMVDNLEESIPLAQAVVAHCGEGPSGLVLARDRNGGLREYLGGDVDGVDQLLLDLNLETRLLATQAPFSSMAAALSSLALAGFEAEPPPALAAPGFRVHSARTLRVQMFEEVSHRLNALLDNGVRQGEIVVIAPVVDPLLVWHVRQTLAARGMDLRVLAGSNRVIDHRPVRILVTLCRLARPSWQAPPPSADVGEMLEVLLGIHPLEAIRLQQVGYPETVLLDPEPLKWPQNLLGLKEAYTSIYRWLVTATDTHHPLDRLLESAFAELYAPRCLRQMAPDGPDAIPWRSDDVLGVLQMDQLIQGARQFRHLATRVGLNNDEIPKHFLRSIYAGELAERPLIPRGVLPEAVTLYTAAKYAEEGPCVPHQIWVDASSPQWHKSDVRELTNPRVLARHWPPRVYTEDDDQRHQADKLARTLQTLVLKSTRAIDVYASDYSSDGQELHGDLSEWLVELIAHEAEVSRGL